MNAAFVHLTIAVAGVGALVLLVLLAVVKISAKQTALARQVSDLTDRLVAGGVIDLSDAELVRQIAAARDSVRSRGVA